MVAGLAVIPLLIGMGAGGADPGELEALRVANDSLRVENESYRTATGELAEQISSLQTALSELGEQSELDPATRAALGRLPAIVRSKAVGGGSLPTAAAAPQVSSATTDTTFGLLKNLLGVMENRLASVKNKVEGQQALARATPSAWPVIGWLTSGYGNRKDPFNGLPDFHAGIDIAAERGTPVRATADGTVQSAGYHGNYGNSVVIDHGFGMGTRFGHLSRFGVSTGQKIKRGEVIGYVGATGRATSNHLHYEILLNGQPLNPLRILGK